MKQVTVNTSGFTLNYNVPENVAEYDRLAKREGAACDDATATTLYRVVFPDHRSQLVEYLVKETGIAVKNNGTEEEPDYESVGKYLRRVIVQLGLTREAFIAKYQAVAQAILDGIPCDPSQRERKSDGPAINKRDKDLAMAVHGKGEEVFNVAITKLSTLLNREIPATIEGLARALADKRRAEAAALEAQMKSALGL